MKPVYKHLSGHAVGVQPNSNGPIRAKMKLGFVSRVTVCCHSVYHKPFMKAKQLSFTQKISIFQNLSTTKAKHGTIFIGLLGTDVFWGDSGNFLARRERFVESHLISK